MPLVNTKQPSIIVTPRTPPHKRSAAKRPKSCSKAGLESIEGVVAAHSLHIWSLTVNKAALAVHLAVSKYKC